MKKPVFVLITADTCGACTRFKATQWEKLNKTLKTAGRVQIVHINLPDMNPVFSKDYPIGLRNIVAWYPTMALVPNNVWVNGKDKEINLLDNCVVMNGQIVDGKLTYGGNIPFSEKDVAKWVTDTLNTHPLFNAVGKQVITVTKEMPKVEIINKEIPRMTNSDVRRTQVVKSDGKTSIVITNGGRPLDSMSNSSNNNGNGISVTTSGPALVSSSASASTNRKYRIIPNYGSFTSFSSPSVK